MLEALQQPAVRAAAVERQKTTFPTVPLPVAFRPHLKCSFIPGTPETAELKCCGPERTVKVKIDRPWEMNLQFHHSRSCTSSKGASRVLSDRYREEPNDDMEIL